MNELSQQAARIDAKRQTVALHAEGLTNAQIAARLKVSSATVAARLSRLGLIANAPARKAERALVSPTPWDAKPGDPRRETAPRGSHMVSLPRERVEAEPLDCAGVVAAIRAIKEAAA